MDDQAQAIGRRVRYWRQRRDINRQRFADMMGRSTSWLDKVEKGERSLLRLPMLEWVADALSVTPEVLTDGAAARRAADCVDAVEVRPSDLLSVATPLSLPNHRAHHSQPRRTSNDSWMT